MRIAREHEFPRRARLPSGEEKSRSTARQRPSAAFVASIAILLTGTLLLAGGLAWARNAEIVWPPWDPAPEIAPIPDVDVQTAPIPRETRAAGRAVCVRLCDGFFFPSATSSGGDEACAAQCPDAPTARYTEPAGSDRIEDAVSTRGALYAALPVANRYQTTLDNMCACRHARAGGYSESLLNDPTLRKGDVVMTPKGFVGFQGAKTRKGRESGWNRGPSRGLLGLTARQCATTPAPSSSTGKGAAAAGLTLSSHSIGSGLRTSACLNTSSMRETGTISSPW